MGPARPGQPSCMPRQRDGNGLDEAGAGTASEPEAARPRGRLATRFGGRPLGRALRRSRRRELREHRIGIELHDVVVPHSTLGLTTVCWSGCTETVCG